MEIHMFRVFILLSFVMFYCGCAEQHAAPIHASSQEHAECLVCKHNADLACVDVAVTDNTPSTVHDGKRYYFCSDDCRQEFAKNPGKYTP
jgi:hypothetical protein